MGHDDLANPGAAWRGSSGCIDQGDLVGGETEMQAFREPIHIGLRWSASSAFFASFGH